MRVEARGTVVQIKAGGRWIEVPKDKLQWLVDELQWLEWERKWDVADAKREAKRE